MRQGPAPAMTSASSARAKRDEAAHARRLAAMFPLDADRLPLLHHAEDLEQQAEALDRQAASAARPGPIEQRQVEQRQAEQQPQEGEAAADDKRPSPRRKPD